MNKRILSLSLLALFIMSPVQADISSTPTAAATATTNAPVRTLDIAFKNLFSKSGKFTMGGLNQSEGIIEFGLRKDEVATKAVLNLQYTPSPSLIPVDSHLKIFLNDELMGVVTFTQEQLGHANSVQIPIDTRYITDFNRIKVNFIGHYKSVCENPASSTLWVDISNSSALTLTLQTLLIKNDLTRFPEPFFDANDNRGLTLPMVFTASPTLMQQGAAGILASWFGTKAKWQSQSYPVLFNSLPQSNAVVFATNYSKPEALKNLAPVTAPTVSMINHPDNPYLKLLVIMGRDDQDLLTAVKGLAQGNILFRGEQVRVDKVEQLKPRKPYDAPNWVDTTKITTFAELQEYKEQLQTSGIKPFPISLSFNIPPDLYLHHTQGIEMHLIYRYTTPSATNMSRLNINLNRSYVRSYTLSPVAEENPTLAQTSALKGLFNTGKNLTLPTLALESSNQLGFDFDYSNSVYSLLDRCETNFLTSNYAVIDSRSTLDFTGLYHYMVMPDLTAFTQAGFPFSRMADLSQTMVLMKKTPQPEEISVLLNTLGNIGSKTGYPALSVRIADDWAQAKNQDVDFLIIGSMPAEFRDNDKMNLLIQATQSWVKQAKYQSSLANLPMNANNMAPASKTTVSSDGAMAAVVGVQSPFYRQRSIIAMLADSNQGFNLLNNALIDKTKLGLMFGSVAVIRDSGIDSLKVGSIYSVGHIPWWVYSWYVMQAHPVMLAISAAIIAFFIGLFLWRVLTRVSKRRLFIDDND